MVLKKPSDFFDRNKDNSSNVNKEEIVPPKKETLENIIEKQDKLESIVDNLIPRLCREP